MPLFHSSNSVFILKISSFHLKYSLKRIAAYLKKKNFLIHCNNYLIKVFHFYPKILLLYYTNNSIIQEKNRLSNYCRYFY